MLSSLTFEYFFVVMEVELQRAVQQCSETDGGVEESEEDAGGGGGRDVHRRLISILNRLLQERGTSREEGGAWDREGHVHTALNF